MALDMHAITVEENHKGRFSLTISDGRHTQQADIPQGLGGLDEGPTPYDRLMSSIASCTAMTIKLYNDVKKWPLEGVDIEVSHRKELDPATNKYIDVISRDISFRGDALTDDQKERLLAIAEKCPIHRTLHSHPEVTTVLEPKTPEDDQLSTDAPAKPAKGRYSAKDFAAKRTLTTHSTGEGKFTQTVSNGKHTWMTDEPPIVPGGLDRGPNPYEELLTALGACTTMKMRSYAEEHGFPLQHISVGLDHRKVRDESGKVVDKFERHITLKGNLTDDQRQQLLDAANNCPILETLTVGPKFETRLVNGPAAPAVGATPAAPKNP